MNRLILAVLLAVAAIAAAPAHSQGPDGQLGRLETRVARLEDRVARSEEAAGAGIVLFVIGCFCALWAQNTRRSALLWFFLGVFFNVITLLVMLRKNSNDLRRQRLRAEHAASNQAGAAAARH